MSDRAGAEQRLRDLDLTLPEPPAPRADYIAVRIAGDHVHVAGQVPLSGGRLLATGRVGVDLDLAAGRQAARQCGLNALAQLKAAVRDLDRISALSAVTIYIAAAPDFAELHLVADEASHLFTAVLGSAGQHSRTVVGVVGLPFAAPVELTLSAVLDPGP